MTYKTGPTNPLLISLVKELKKKAIEEKVGIWKRVAEDLEKPTRQRREVNLYTIDKYAKDGEIIVVPGKVLGTGDITKKVNVAAFSFSQSALDKILKVGGKTLTIQELVKQNSKGKDVRIMG
ncbi:MAG: 50S ribosomal protein L18e [Candidatus Woesearchaeota archaeon]